MGKDYLHHVEHLYCIVLIPQNGEVERIGSLLIMKVKVIPGVVNGAVPVMATLIVYCCGELYCALCLQLEVTSCSFSSYIYLCRPSFYSIKSI